MLKSLQKWAGIGVAASIATMVLPAGAVATPRFVHSIQYTIKLGSATATEYAQVITQSTANNDVYFAEGAKVLVVAGHAAPAKFVTAPVAVLALCVTSADLYVETANSIVEYTVPGGTRVGSWPLPSGLGPSKNTSAGMSVEGAHLWTWTDWATDESGYEYGSVVEFNTTTWSNKILDKESANPGDVAVSSLGYFYLANDRVVRAEPGGTQLKSAKTGDASDAPVAVLGNTIYLDATREPSGNNVIDSFSASTMQLQHAKQVPTTTYGILGTPLGLVGIHTHGANGSIHDVVLINATSGAETDAVNVPGAASLLFGTTMSAIGEVSGEMYLYRLH
jgi:hypothetical protein